ncbi:MAG: FMN-binding protein [Melioribacteraceae bacterium]|nr:FMN-binding protein [Melioribacteraceae bacterium]
MKKIIIISLILISNIIASEIKDKSETMIKQFFKKDVDLSFEKFQINPILKKEIEMNCKQMFFRSEVYLWEIKSEYGIEAIAILDNVKGKNLPITFLVIFDLDGTIKYSTIVKYREEHGGAVKQNWWQKQFRGLNGNDEISIGANIEAISGATISSNSVTKGIKKVALLFNLIKMKYAD